jgi:crossover junction endodeoxyribonuclease RuvC
MAVNLARLRHFARWNVLRIAFSFGFRDLDRCDTVHSMGVSLKQFQQMKDRVAGNKRQAIPILEPSFAAAPRQPQVVLGVDPSLRGTGYGVIRFTNSQPQALGFGTIAARPGWERSRCLRHIAETLRQVLQEHRPTVCVVEGLFYAQNLKTALIMGEARGASLVTIAEAGLEIYELAPRKVKQAIVGYGAAQKYAVARMVQRMLGLSEPPAPDAADALALALAYAQENRRYSLEGRKRI